ncbi:MAG: EI24 domain-containing protein [Rhodocyclaceae bacterium]|nr:EI24 domain-containing protein [Rhodocyclaceae bacterium]
MLEVFAAFTKAARDLVRGDILWQALWPPLVALVAWGFVATAVWAHAIALISGALPTFEWTGWTWMAHWAAVFLLLAAFASLVYATALLLVATFSLPRMLALVAARDYPDVLPHGENVFWSSLGNTLAASGIYIVGWLATLPLLLVPGAILVLPLAWTAWLNQRTFRFDALAEHATRSELRTLTRGLRARFYLGGFGTALAAHIPLVNLLAPAYTALVFVHLALSGLRRLRQESGVTL